MKKTLPIFLGSFLVFLLLGSGCQPPEDLENPNEKNTSTEIKSTTESMTNKTEITDTEKITEVAETEIKISKAESTEKGILKIEFEVGEKLAEDAEAYILLLSQDEEPTYPTKGYWYELGKAHTKKEWVELPSGERHLRICVKKDGKCDVYTSDLKVEVK